MISQVTLNSIKDSSLLCPLSHMCLIIMLLLNHFPKLFPSLSIEKPSLKNIKIFAHSEIWTHESCLARSWVWRLRPLGHMCLIMLFLNAFPQIQNTSPLIAKFSFKFQELQNKKNLHTVRFELTRVASPDLESGALDRSAMCAFVGILKTIPSK